MGLGLHTIEAPLFDQNGELRSPDHLTFTPNKFSYFAAMITFQSWLQHSFPIVDIASVIKKIYRI